MSNGPMLQKHLDELGQIVDRLMGVNAAAQKAFTHHNINVLLDLIPEQESISREIKSVILKMNESVRDKSGEEREPYLRLLSILTHLQKVAESIGSLGKSLQEQIKERVLFSDKAIHQTNQLFDQHSSVLTCLVSAIRKGDETMRCRAVEQCLEMKDSCIYFGTEHETRLVEGLCLPQSAPFFLAILDHMQTMIHHEHGVANLLGHG